eukprot:GHVQ01011096.1.p1 GENE.GHVQ01011096.1~~GHVQ01011096.1.p1  ORF type:complete len:296 (-),score=18.01 GHVQ01011096.1:524-1411(-)
MYRCMRTWSTVRCSAASSVSNYSCRFGLEPHPGLCPRLLAQSSTAKSVVPPADRSCSLAAVMPTLHYLSRPSSSNHRAMPSQFLLCRRFTTRNISGRLFYKRRPLQLPKHKFRNWRSKWLQGSPHKKGICVKVFVQTPRKPNSGLRKVARVRLSTGKSVLTYIPGMGHNLNVHSVVLVRGGRTKDVPSCNYKAVRGACDLLPVKNRWHRRSRFGVKLSDVARSLRLDRQNHKKPLWIESDREWFNKHRWATWTNPDGSVRDRPLSADEQVPTSKYWNVKYRLKLSSIEARRNNGG